MVKNVYNITEGKVKYMLTNVKLSMYNITYENKW